MYTSGATCKSFSSSRSLIHVLAWQEGKKKKILESNRRTARKNKAIFAHCVIVRLPQIQEHHSCLWPFWCQFGASTRHNSRFLLPGAQANKIALERIYARASEKEGLVKARKKAAGNPGNMTPITSRSTIWHLIFLLPNQPWRPPQGKGWMAICNHAGRFDFRKENSLWKTNIWKMSRCVGTYFHDFLCISSWKRSWFSVVDTVWGVLVGTFQVPEHFEDEVELGGDFRSWIIG